MKKSPINSEMNQVAAGSARPRPVRTSQRAYILASIAGVIGLGNIWRFPYMAGQNGGGPYALSCAWKIPKRLNSVGIFASVGPFIPETDKNIAAPVRMMWANAPKLPGLFKMQMKLFSWLARKYPKFYVKMILREFSETDRTVYERLNIAELIQVDRNEGYRQGGIGTWYDAMIPGNWPIPLNEIKTKFYLWEGEEDISVPLSMGQYMAEKLPNCEVKFIKGVGHFWIFEHLAEMLEKLVMRQ